MKPMSYVRGIVARGEAAKADAQGKLPFGKTHEIVGETADGLPILTLLWQIYSSCMFAHIHLWQCGHRFGGIRAMRATMA